MKINNTFHPEKILLVTTVYFGLAFVVLMLQGVILQQNIFFSSIGVVTSTICIGFCTFKMFRCVLLKSVASVILAFFYTIVSLSIFYYQYTGHPFDPKLVTDVALGDAITTIILLSGVWQFILLIILFICCIAAYYLLFNRLHLWIPHRPPGAFIAFLGIFLVFSLSQLKSVHANMPSSIEGIETGIFPPEENYEIDSNENVFILQLESMNSVALNGEAIVDNRAYTGNYMPNLMAIAKSGVFFPYFLANTIQTHRAVETILCGIVHNFGPGYSFAPETIGRDCLPRLLKKDGYRTYYFQGHANLDFTNLRNFTQQIGFDHIHSNDILKEGDRQYGWGTDDCDFYQRIFETLKNERNDEKLFVYIAVSSHHVPYEFPSDYQFLRKFPIPSNGTEKYLNTALYQDYCLKTFYNEYEQFLPENTHLIILGDHSVPVGIHENMFSDYGINTDSFLIPFVYIPPRAKVAEYDQGKVIADPWYGQDDLLATISSLLNETKKYENSFSHELKKNWGAVVPFAYLMGKHEYDACHISVQPYGGGATTITNHDDRYTYQLDTKEVSISNMRDDKLEANKSLLGKGVSYAEFMERYLCRRYRGTSQN